MKDFHNAHIILLCNQSYILCLKCCVHRAKKEKICHQAILQLMGPHGKKRKKRRKKMGKGAKICGNQQQKSKISLTFETMDPFSKC